MLFTVLQLQLLTTHLAVELSIQKDVPSGKVPVDKVLAGEVSHPICNLPGEPQQKGSGVGVLRRAGGEGKRDRGGRDSGWNVFVTCCSRWCSTYSTLRR